MSSKIYNNGHGIDFLASHDKIISGNEIRNNKVGIYLADTSGANQNPLLTIDVQDVRWPPFDSKISPDGNKIAFNYSADGWGIYTINIDGTNGICNKDYNAMELSVHPGEVLVVHKIVNGFGMSEKTNGRRGWVPMKNMEAVEK